MHAASASPCALGMAGSSSSSSWISGALQQVAQNVPWSYAIFWRLCPHQGALVWGDGYYNGAIKTRKTVLHQLAADKETTSAATDQLQAEDAALHRSHQLRDLYQSLLLSGTTASGECTNPRRACAALSPEDLTESEWFYLMSASFSFPSGVGLPGKAFETRRHVWLTRANEVDSKVFSRAILAKSARIQTVVCIPIADGVLELGTTEKVEEDIALVQHARSFFINNHQYHLKPALSEHSSSNPPFFHSPMGSIPQPCNEEECNEEDGDEEESDEGSDGDTEENREEKVNPVAVEPVELLQIEMSESIRLGSPDDCSNNLRQSDPLEAWNLFQEKYCDSIPQSSGFASVAQIQEKSQQDAHYSETVSVILQYNMTKLSTDSSCNFSPSQLSAFTASNHIENQQPLIAQSGASPQQMLKHILFTVPNLSSNYKFGGRGEKSPINDRDGEGSNGCKFQRGTAQEDLSANHVLAERRRREKLNERFIILRSLVPFVTKMDKASILGDTIEYVKQLRKRIQDLESQDREMESYSLRASSMDDQAAQTSSGGAEKKRRRVTDDRNGSSKGGRVVQVSIIESDALLELQCSYREGMLLKIMNRLHDLMLEITSIQSSTYNGVFEAEIRAKVKEAHGRKTSIVEVKKAIHQIFP